MMMKNIKSIVLAVAFATACGGAHKTSETAMNDQAKKAPPPPGHVTANKKIERKVSVAAKASFKEAVDFYNAKQDANKGLWSDADCTAAAEKFEEVGKSNDKLVEAWFDAGVAYQNCGDTKNAEAEYRQALKIHDSHGPSLSNLGAIYLKGGNEKVAEDYFTKAIEADGNIAAAYINLGWIYYQRLKTAASTEERDRWVAQARKELQLALAVDNVNVTARITMAMVYIEGSETNKNSLELANLLLDQIVKAKPVEDPNASEEGKKVFEEQEKRWERDNANPMLWHAYGLIFLRRNNVGKALENFQKAVTLDPEFVEARMNIGSLVIGFRKYDEAEAQYRAVLKLQPKNYDAMIGLAVALRGQKKGDEAEALYKQAMGLDKDRADAYFDLGLLWMTRTSAGAGEIADYQNGIKAAQTAKDFFNQYLSKAGDKAPKDKKQEATDKIKDADEYVSSYGDAIKDKQKMIEDQKNNPTPPAGGGDAKPDGAGGAGGDAKPGDDKKPDDKKPDDKKGGK